MGVPALIIKIPLVPFSLLPVTYINTAPKNHSDPESKNLSHTYKREKKSKHSEENIPMKLEKTNPLRTTHK